MKQCCLEFLWIWVDFSLLLLSFPRLCFKIVTMHVSYFGITLNGNALLKSGWFGLKNKISDFFLSNSIYNFISFYFFLFKNRLQMTEMTQNKFCFYFNKKKLKVNWIFPFEVKVRAANLSLKVHVEVSGEGKLFTFALRPAVIWQNMLTCNSAISINQNDIILRVLEPSQAYKEEIDFH